MGSGARTRFSPSAGCVLRQTTVRLERARFAGLGILKTDFAVAARGGIALCDVAVARTRR